MRSFPALVFSLLTYYRADAQPRPQHVTSLRIDEVVYLGEDRQYTITSDSIKVKISKVLAGEFKDTAFAKQLSPQERDRLFSSVDRIYLSAIQPNYYRPATKMHKPLYKVTIIKGSYIRVTSITNAKVDFFYSFCLRLNNLLPLAFRINYPQTDFDG